MDLLTRSFVWWPILGKDIDETVSSYMIVSAHDYGNYTLTMGPHRFRHGYKVKTIDVNTGRLFFKMAVGIYHEDHYF